MLGGYPGAVLLPVVTGLLRLHPFGRTRPLLLGGLLAVASAIGAVGEHLVYSGGSGLPVTAAANAIPQVICLIVVGGIAAACLDADPGDGA
jgi:hypothetical protein